MSRSKSQPDWSQPLTHPIRLRSGGELTTLRDAAEYICHRLPDQTQLHPSCQYAAELLMRAAESRRPADRREATDQLCRALDGAGLLKPWFLDTQQ